MTIEPDERILDWKSNHDPRSLEYPVRAVIRSAVKPKDKLWTPGPILDQGREGACVGFAWAAEGMAEPIPVDLQRLRANTPTVPNLYARFLYGQARYIDQWAGEAYEGTSVLAGAKAAQNMRTLRTYRWAFSTQDVIDSVIKKGPVVIGINWYNGMYEAPNGILRRSGALVGGHALLVVGFKVNSEKIPGQSTFILQNSWGNSWGINGLAEITVADLDALLRENGEACVPVSRSYGR